MSTLAAAPAAARRASTSQSGSWRDGRDQQRPLTAPGQPFDGGEMLRKVAVLMSEPGSATHRLRVLRGRRHEPCVTSLLADLSQRKIRVRVEEIDEATLRSCYGERARHVSSTAETLQRRANFLRRLSRAAEAGASDVRLTVLPDAAVLRHKVHGRWKTVEELTVDEGRDLQRTCFALADLASHATYNPYEFQHARLLVSRLTDTDRAAARLDRLRACRLNFMPLEGLGRGLSIRLLPEPPGRADLASCGYDAAQLEDLEHLRRRPHGAVFFSGPMGSGKSQSLRYMLETDYRENDGARYMMTVEDPAEHEILGAEQLSIPGGLLPEERRVAFSQAMMTAVRNNPDVLMVGEVRDSESGAIAIEAANVGVGLYATVHANDALSIPARLAGPGLELDPALIYSPAIMAGLINQRLVPLLCPSCREPLSDVGTPQAERMRRGLAAHGDVTKIFVEGRGCTACRGLGRTGRTVAAEIVVCDAELLRRLAEAARNPALLPSASEYWRRELGGRPMAEHARDLVVAGLADPFAAEQLVGPLVPDGRRAGRVARSPASAAASQGSGGGLQLVDGQRSGRAT
ncbi:Type II secretory pathway ATPase GspE/PulE or T4P pilus assembly pathway ATPase PilB [Tistlia consotensis]|uniref:Type II secretory pathway ATPase GspE/PulE or T4P pilus assembly pathway ATPase PilB n=2 Tax=Tistlia TaxID=1321364 RepID=A0A1Y6BSG9_9PROT|nr:Type II secretory pathway ATPase GspE/PulE or T4P pilus assembly pathway ATPase PilB [Tistlia consotensis USBA 355]SNR66615.1 Type II secretory pathway ATPase GspE/PulE or T4P pilus assembly pathway ATPase PilB [Tistlia consotensis]